MSIINDFKNEFRFSAHGRTSRRNFWIYQIGLFVLGLAVAMGCGTIIGLTNAVVGFWFIIAALLILPFGIAWYFALLAAGMFASALDKVVPVASLIVTVIVYVCLSQKSQPGLNKYDVTE